ncbi:MAG: PAS domain S-box protein [Gammaproteobacteria bacterium]
MRGGIAAKIAAIFSALALVGTLIVALVITEGSRALLVDASAQRLSHTAQIVGVRFNDIVQAVRSDADFLSRNSVIQDMVAEDRSPERDSQGRTPGEAIRRDEAAASFQAFLESRPWYQSIAVMVIEGDDSRERLRVERGADSIAAVPPDQLEDWESDADRLTAIALPEGRLHLSEIALQRVKGRAMESPIPVMGASMVIGTPAGTRNGVLHISINMRQIFNALDDLVDPEAMLYVTDQQGDFLHPADPGKGLGLDLEHHHTLPQLLPPTRALFSGAAEVMSLDNVQWQPEAPQIAHFERLTIDRAEPARYLVIGIASPRAAVLEEVNAVRRRSAVYTLLFALVGVGLVLWVSHRLTAPLREVSRAVARFSRGESHVPLPYGGSDEIGILADNFRLLADRVTSQLRSLEEKEGRLRSIIETAVDGIIVVDHRGHVEAFNPAAERIFGYRVAEVMGRNVSMLMTSPDREQHDEYIQRYLQTGEAHIIGSGRIVTGLHKEGHTIPLYLSIGEFLQSGERKFTGILHDISRDQFLYRQSDASPPSG